MKCLSLSFALRAFLLLSILFNVHHLYAAPQQKIKLAAEKRAALTVLLPSDASVGQQFAAAELSRYLGRISGASFRILTVRRGNSAAIRLETVSGENPDAYSIEVFHSGDILLQGASDRALLYAVYDFLGRLGCRWLAPQFSFYQGSAEYVPRKPQLWYEDHGAIRETPALKYRKLDVEEGRSHDTANLKQLIDWMPRLRFNTLIIPLDYGGWGKVKWDKWREALIPELKKRGLMIEVGGHGYQNFLNAGMEDSTLFKKHPDWFGEDKNCNPTPDPYSVFNTANPEAVNYLLHNLTEYIRQRPEIDIFDFWPPDGARWADCKAWDSLGSPLDRQAALVNRADSAIRAVRPSIRLEMIAYQPVLDPPPQVALNREVLVDFCPINQQFEKSIDDTAAANNHAYATSLQRWRNTFTGDIGLYSYYRKYAWRSLPVIIPHYMQHDLRWYKKMPVQGISTYAEPGDWFTYELNHYVLGQLAWNPDVSVDSLVGVFCRARYGDACVQAKHVLEVIETTVRFLCNIPYTTRKSAAELAAAEQKLRRARSGLLAARQHAKSPVRANLSRLLLPLDYALYDIEIQRARLKDTVEARKKVGEMVRFLEANRDSGVFILPARDPLVYFEKRYGLDTR
ncbi:MAG TPA: DUF4838 domain-containing protein [Puia sp.]|nr:DUF4838 domain-containing protein [Puia sp.]